MSLAKLVAAVPAALAMGVAAGWWAGGGALLAAAALVAVMNGYSKAYSP